METVELKHVELLERAGLPEPAGDRGQVARLVAEFLEAVGEDPQRPGLQRTPERVARMFGELLAGYQTDPVALVNDAIFTSSYQDTVLIRDIEFYSLCEHHLLPFFGSAHIAYVPDGRVLGLSKFPRIVDMYARRLQIQEQMTQQIADFVRDVLQPKGLIVMVEAAHLCAMMRGVKKSGVRMVTTATQGVFKSDASLRQEVLGQMAAATGYEETRTDDFV